MMGIKKCGVPYFSVALCALIITIWLVPGTGEGPSPPRSWNMWFHGAVSPWKDGCEDWRPQVYRLVSYSFVHATSLHIASNVVGLLLFGLVLEHYAGVGIAASCYFCGVIIGMPFLVLVPITVIHLNAYSST
jgi:membrane associated rhomboid family serine protease